LLASPNICSKRWVYQQYDSVVQHNTYEGPGGDAAVLRIEGTPRALAISTDGNGRFCQLDPRVGAALAVAEAARNVACSGARPVAITNCLNFGNPEHPDVMWQFSEAIAGISEACLALGTPVTGGNVSFYNQTGDTQIHPTPVIGTVGILEDAEARVGVAWTGDHDVILLGETRAELGGSEWAWVAHEHLGGTPPQLDLEAERRLVDLLCELAEGGRIASAHDCSEGGLAVTLAECSIASGVGVVIQMREGFGFDPHIWLFAESASRAVVTAPDSRTVVEAARAAGVPARAIGRTGGARLTIPGVLDVAVADMARAYEDALPSLLA